MSKSSVISEINSKVISNNVRAVSAQDVRESMNAIVTEMASLNDDAYSGMKGLKPGIGTIANLKSIPTTSGISVGSYLSFRDTGSSDVLRVYELVSGTDAESSPNVIRPNDYNGTTNQKVWKIAVVGGSNGTFNSDFVVSLSGGKTLGKYTNGQTVPANGKTANQVLLDIAIEYIAPTWNSFSVTGQNQTVEVGTTLSGSKTFTWSINSNSGVVTLIDIYDITGSANLLANTPNDETQSVGVTTLQLNSNGATQSWRGVAHDTGTTPGDINSSPFTVTARFLDFWGPASGTPANSAAVRALSNNDFRTGGNVRTLVTGTTLTQFVVATLGTISSVIDQTALNANITSDYVSLGTISVNDAGGTARTYNLYKMTIGAPYAVSHNHLITIA